MLLHYVCCDIRYILDTECLALSDLSYSIFPSRTTGVLHHFVGNFVQKVFLDQILYEVSEKASAVTKGHDALRNLCDSNTQKDLLLPRPLLKVMLCRCILKIVLKF